MNFRGASRRRKAFQNQTSVSGFSSSSDERSRTSATPLSLSNDSYHRSCPSLQDVLNPSKLTSPSLPRASLLLSLLPFIHSPPKFQPPIGTLDYHPLRLLRSSSAAAKVHQASFFFFFFFPLQLAKLFTRLDDSRKLEITWIVIYDRSWDGRDGRNKISYDFRPIERNETKRDPPSHHATRPLPLQSLFYNITSQEGLTQDGLWCFQSDRWCSVKKKRGRSTTIAKE